MIFKEITVSDSRQLPDGNWKKLEWVAELEKDEVPEIATRMVKERIDQTFVMVYGVNPNGSFAPFRSQQQNDAFIQSLKITPESEEQSLLEEIAKATAETINQWQIPALRNSKTKEAFLLRKQQLNIN